MLKDNDFPPPVWAELGYYNDPDDLSRLVQRFVNRVNREQGREIGGTRIGVGAAGVYCCIRHTYEAPGEPPCHQPAPGEFREMTGIPYRDETVQHLPNVVV